KIEAAKFACPFREEIQKVPLRHQRNKLAMRRHASEICDLKAVAAGDTADGLQLLMRHCQELVQNSKFVHQFQGGGMDRISTEVAKEILVLFEHTDVYAFARQQISEHDTSRPAAHNATRSLKGACHSRTPPPPQPSLYYFGNNEKGRVVA